VINKLRDLAGFTRFVLRRWNDDRCPLIAGSLTYTTILALAPMFAVGVAVLSASPFFEEVMSKFKIFLLLNLAPEVAGTIIRDYMTQFERNATRLTLVGGALVLVVSVWLLLTIDKTLNAIWRVRQTRPLWMQVVGYAALTIAAPVLVGVSVTVTTHLMMLQREVGAAPPRLQTWLLHAVPTVMSTIAFFLVYRIIPHRKVPWSHALLGGFVAAILFEAAKELFEVYVHATPTYRSVYGAFAAVPLFLIWIYFSWLVVLLGAELTASASYWHRGLWKEAAKPGVRFREALALTQALLAAGTPLSFYELTKRTRLPAFEVEETLAQMEEGGVIRVVTRDTFELSPGTLEVLATRAEPATTVSRR
jgi:membrane protein